VRRWKNDRIRAKKLRDKKPRAAAPADAPAPPPPSA